MVSIPSPINLTQAKEDQGPTTRAKNQHLVKSSQKQKEFKHHVRIDMDFGIK